MTGSVGRRRYEPRVWHHRVLPPSPAPHCDRAERSPPTAWRGPASTFSTSAAATGRMLRCLPAAGTIGCDIGGDADVPLTPGAPVPLPGRLRRPGSSRSRCSNTSGDLDWYLVECLRPAQAPAGCCCCRRTASGFTTPSDRLPPLDARRVGCENSATGVRAGGRAAGHRSTGLDDLLPPTRVPRGAAAAARSWAGPAGPAGSGHERPDVARRPDHPPRPSAPTTPPSTVTLSRRPGELPKGAAH